MIVSLFLCTASFAQAGGLLFSLTDLGTFNGTWSEAFAINDHGVIVGNMALSAGGTRCFEYDHGSVTLFQGGAKPPMCVALAIDIKGNVAGATSVSPNTTVYRAFVYEAGKVQMLSMPAGYDYSMALGIRESTVVGGVGSTSDSAYCGLPNCPVWYSGLINAVKWDNNVVTTITTGNHDYGNYARGINNNGEIVGRLYNWNLTHGTDAPAPWLWKNGVLSYLPMYNDQGWYYGEANAINDAGVIAGGGGFYNGVVDGICVLEWNSQAPSNLPTAILPCDGSHFINGMALSLDNWVVGYADFGYSVAPFLAVPNCGRVSLSTLLDASGAAWDLNSVNGINRYHQIVGSAISHQDGQKHAILLTPNNLPMCPSS